MAMRDFEILPATERTCFALHCEIEYEVIWVTLTLLYTQFYRFLQSSILPNTSQPAAV